MRPDDFQRGAHLPRVWLSHGRPAGNCNDADRALD